MPTTLPASDPIVWEQALRQAIYETLMSVDLIQDHVNVHKRERFPDNKEDDEQVSTVPDLVNSDLLMTSIIQICMPTITEIEYTGDTCTKLTLTYPITFDFGVKDEWNQSNGPLEITNSSDFALAVYLKARKKFKDNRTLGYDNVSHDYLQQDNAGTVEDEETNGRLHTADWSLTVHCTGVLI